MRNSIYSLPIYFSTKNELSNSDERFLEVEIDVLHDGLNFNQSIFTKEVVNENIETIKNTPILGFIRELPNGEKDFKGHEYIITKTDKDGLTRKYIGNCFGIIPESCNPRWVSKVSEDGETRNYLRVDGLLWSRFSESTDIIMRDIDKPHSMELYPNNVEGYEDEDGNFVFEKFSFDGCCILGSTDDIQPAMISSNIKLKDKEVQFSMSDFAKELKEELNDKYNTFANLINEKQNKQENNGGTQTMSNTDFSVTVEQFENISTIVSQFESIQDKYGDSYPRYYAIDVQDNEVIVVDKKNNYDCYGFEYSINEDKLVVDFACGGKKKKTTYTNYEENTVEPNSAFNFGKHIEEIENKAFSKIDEVNVKVSEYEVKISELTEAKATIETNYSNLKADYDEMKTKYDEYVQKEQVRQENELNSQKDAEFARFEDSLGENADFVALKEKKSEMSVEDITAQCSILFTRLTLENKVNFSRSNNQDMTLGVMDNTDNDMNGYVSTKYGNIPVRR